MCNLYRMTKNATEVAKLFAVEFDGASNAGGDVYPGYPGLVVAEGRLRSMTWGFPLALRGKKGQLLKPKPVNNARTDKLATPFWTSSFTKRRCLIPLTAWAEAEGPAGHKVRTWLSLPDQDLFSCAGVWRGSEEWGDVYSMVMTDAAGAARETHTRMPVIIRPEDREEWLGGAPDEAFALCRPYAGEITLERTRDPWVHHRSGTSGGSSAHS